MSRDVVTLAAYPFVVVRIACRRCPRRGAYRLARLAERSGAEMPLVLLIDELAADCPKRAATNPDVYDRCGAFLPDPEGGRPPDLPPGAPGMRLRLVASR